MGLCLEGVGHGLLECHLSTDSEGNGEVFLVKLGREGVSRLLAQALFIALRDVARFLTQPVHRTRESGRPLRVPVGDGERGELSQAPDRHFLVDQRLGVLETLTQERFGFVAAALASREDAETDEAFHDFSLVAELTEESEALLEAGPRLRVIALLQRDLGQVADGDGEKPGEASRAGKLCAFRPRRCCSLVVAEPVSRHTQADQRARDSFCVSEAASEHQALLHERLRPLVVAEPVGEERGPEECLQTRLGLVIVRYESVLQAAASLAQVTAHVPEAHQRSHEA